MPDLEASVQDHWQVMHMKITTTLYFETTVLALMLFQYLVLSRRY